MIHAITLHGICGSEQSCRFGHHAMDLKNENAGPKYHWRLWKRSSFSVIPSDWDLNDDPLVLSGA